MMAMPGAQQQSGFTTPLAGEQPAYVSYNMNGLVSSYSQTAIVDPSGTPTWWPAFGQLQRVGDTYAEPFLQCPNPNAPCTFNGSGAVINNASACSVDSAGTNQLEAANGNNNGTQSGMGNIHATSWCFNHTENWAFSDGHAKSRPTATGDVKVDPWPINGYDSSGVPDNANGVEGHSAVFDQYCHTPVFRPDITH